jgi:periplasmic protein TonB
MSSHQNSAYNSEYFQLPRRNVAGARSSKDVRQTRPHLSGAPVRLTRSPEDIWGQYNNYRANGVAISAMIHVFVIGLLLSGIFVTHQVVQKQVRQQVTLIAPSPDTYAPPVAKQVVSGGGGGGERDVIPAPKAVHPPKMAMQQITPPAIVMHNPKPKLTAEPTVVAPPQVKVADNHLPVMGAPTSAAPMPAAPPSNGTGSGGGIGSGSGGGVGVGHGPGLGAGSGGGMGGGVYRVGAGISAPTAISSPDPDYTEEARRAKKQGTCVLWLIVDSTGHPRDIRVARGLGFGLDAKAVEAVKQWRFQPALKDGKPVDVQISVEVEFHLY